eukprot:Gb_11036 [translate_table: standard]
MAVPQPFISRKEKLIWFRGLVLRFERRKRTIHTATGGLERKCNGKIATSQDLRMLCKQGRLKEVMQILQSTGQRVETSIYVYLLQLCIKKKALTEGKRIHNHMNERGIFPEIWLQNTLVNMYAKCGSLLEARRAFDEMPKRDVCSWTVMIQAYARYGFCEEALALFHQMQRNGVQPDQFTFASVLPACANLEAIDYVHDEIIRSGFLDDVFVGSALVDMYAKCGSIQRARNVFDKMPKRDMFSWTVMIAACCRHGLSEEALTLFYKMQRTGIQPDQFTFASVLSACANLAALEQGMEIHEEIIRNGVQFDIVVENALVDMYAKCGSIEKACHVFDKMHQRDVVSWTAMIAGYVQNGQGLKALKFFRQMELAGVKPNLKTFVSVLPACAELAALEQGVDIHENITRSGFKSDVFVESALVDMYAKCGSLEKARDVFDKMNQRNAISWTAMIGGYAMHGCANEALELFEQMQHFGKKPDHVTLVCVLSACCHAGLVDEGRQYFDCMSQYYHITPTMEHYGCMVDLLGRAGRLDEAQDFVNSMSIKPDATVWRCLLGAFLHKPNYNVVAVKSYAGCE